MLAMATQEHNLPFITMAYWATPQESTSLTPYFLLFG